MVTDFTAELCFLGRAVGATLLGGVPTLFLRILDDPELSTVQLPALSAVIVGEPRSRPIWSSAWSDTSARLRRCSTAKVRPRSSPPPISTTHLR